MSDLWYNNMSADSIKSSIKCSIMDASRSFVAVGFYLKQVRDRELYKEDGYADIWEYASKEFSISKSTASRFMAVNDRFSKYGNSPILLEQYKNFSSSKLTEMLTLTDAQMEQVTPQSTVKEIRGLKQPKKKREEPKENRHETVVIDWVQEWCKMNITKEARNLILTNPELFEVYFNARLVVVGASCDNYYGEGLSHISSTVMIRFMINKNIVFSMIWEDLMHQVIERVTNDTVQLVNLVENEEGLQYIKELKKSVTTSQQPKRNIWDEYRAKHGIGQEEQSDIIDVEAKDVTEVSESVNKSSEIVTKEPESVIKEQKNDYKDLTSWINSNGKYQYEQIKDVIWNTFTSTNTNSMDELAEVITNAVSIWVLDQSMGYRDYLIHCDIPSADSNPEPKSMEQPEFPKLTNNDQRKEWLGKYRDWPIWSDNTITGERYYRYDFANGDAIVVKESLKHKFDSNYHRTEEVEYGAKEYYHLHHDKDCTFYESASNMSCLCEFLKEIQKGK